MSTVSSASSTNISTSGGTTHLNSTVGGIDIDALVSATIAAKSLPITLLQNKNAVLTAKINDFSTIKTALQTLQYAAQDLTYDSAFSGRKATSSDETVVTASATNGGSNGSYAIDVTSMATITSNSSNSIGNGGSKATVTSSAAVTGTTVVTGGTFTINGKDITVAAGDTFDSVISKINSASAGVTASITNGKVTISQNKAGTVPTIALTDTADGFLANELHLGAVVPGVDDTSAGTYTTVTGSAAFDPTKLNQTITDYTGSGVTAGSFTINGKSISITATDTINTIANKITASGANVKATVGADGKITLTQKTAGKDATITLSDDGNTGFFTAAGITQAAATAGIGRDSDISTPLKDVNGLGSITSGYFSINGTFFAVDTTVDTVNSIIAKINASTTAGVSAFYDSTTHKISLTSQTSGAEDITLGTGSTDSSNFLSQVGLAQNNQISGADAVVTVNGVAATATNNQITYQGNTFTLVGKGNATVTVTNDVDATVTKVNAFITAYNAAMDAIVKKETEKADSTSQDASVGDLFGDSTLSSIDQALRNYSSTILSSQSSTMQQLAQVGITTGAAGTFDIDKVQSGHLELDETVLRAALASDPTGVETLFGNTTVHVDTEAVGTGDGTTMTYTLKHGSDLMGDPVIKVGNTTYTLADPADFKPYNPGGNPPVTTHSTQYSIDRTTGAITFAEAPTDKITADYDYDVSTGSNAGIFVQMNSLLTSYTQYGGTIDATSGSNGDLQQSINYNNDRITDLQYRLSQEQATLYTQYQNMQTTLDGLQSQGSYITALLSSLSSSK
jgi:flagellar hook-associated protein 2